MKITEKISVFTQKNWQGGVVIILALVFFIGTSSFNLLTQEQGGELDFVKWGSPDETANYIFAKLYGQEGQLFIQEDYNLYTRDIMHPRSIRSDYGVLKPVSFLGLPLIYGKIVDYIGYKSLPYLTPLWASIGIIFFYLLVKKLFNPQIALVSALLMGSFPAYIYYTARSMFHNVLFIALIIIGLYFLLLTLSVKRELNRRWKDLLVRHRIRRFFSVKKIKNSWRQLVWAAVSGLFIGAAIIVRSSELLWLTPLLIIIWLPNIRSLGITKVVIFLSFLGLALLPGLYYNQALYGSYYYGGYPEMNQSLVDLARAGNDFITSTAIGQFTAQRQALAKFFDTIFFFGFKPYQSLKMFYLYYVEMFAPYFTLAVLGFGIFLVRRRSIKPRQLIYTVALFLVSFILVAYYGSWQFFDNPDKSAHTIGNSYTRYWLPIYLGALPFASIFILRLGQVIELLMEKIQKPVDKIKFWQPRASQKIIKIAVTSIILICFYFVSVEFIVGGSDEGLVYLAQKQKNDKYQWERILALTESNATIITQYHDKLLFPERKVIVGLFDDKNMVAQYRTLLNYLPVYYYNFSLPSRDLDYLGQRRLGEGGISIEVVEKINSDFTLYRLLPKNEI